MCATLFRSPLFCVVFAWLRSHLTRLSICAHTALWGLEKSVSRSARALCVFFSAAPQLQRGCLFYNSVTVALFEFFLSLLRTDEFLTWRRDRKKVAALLSWLLNAVDRPRFTAGANAVIFIIGNLEFFFTMIQFDLKLLFSTVLIYL